jgi:glutathione S-transferase
MSYTLVSSERSPFGRICRMLMHTHKIQFEFQILNFVDDAKAAEDLAAQTPINKVPILMDGGQKIFDSRVIANHLIKKHGLKPLTLEEENLVSAIYSILDTSLILFMMKREGFDLGRKGFFIKRNLDRIPSNLEFIIPWARGLDPQKAGDWNYASMSLYSCLHWVETRAETLKTAEFPALELFLKKFAHAPGVQETRY